jgi:ribosome-associated protein
MQFIGKQMRMLTPEQLDAVRATLIEQHMPSAQETLALHQAEQWRDRLVADDDAVSQWLTLSPETDSQQLRALVRQARKDAKPEKPGEALRHGRAYRDIFQLVRTTLMENAQGGRPNEEAPYNDADEV